jgi:putative FmdB family regulatory protein
MPTYEYACKSCDEHLEVVQSFKDDALTTCPACGGPLRKVFGSIGISFKGSGFYRTDSRPAAKSESSPDKSSDKSPAEKSPAEKSPAEKSPAEKSPADKSKGRGEKSSSSRSSESGKAAAAS